MIEDYFIDFIFMNKMSEEDGMGGFEEVWKEGANFKGGISVDNTTEGQIAGKQGVTSLYTVTVKDNVPLKYSDIIKRKSDNQTFRITTDKADGTFPKVATIPIIKYKAELHKLT